MTGCGDLNELNIPRHDHKQQIYAQHVISQAGLHLHDLTAALSDYHTYSEQRLHAVFTTLSPVNERVSRQMFKLKREPSVGTTVISRKACQAH